MGHIYYYVVKVQKGSIFKGNKTSVNIRSTQRIPSAVSQCILWRGGGGCVAKAADVADELIVNIVLSQMITSF